MTTYSKETALYNTGAIGADIQEAGTTADNYLTDISGGGVMVHPSDDSTTGWKISSALELLKSGVSYIWAGLVNNIATVRIGKETGGHSVIDENGMRVYGDSSGNTQLANIGYGDAQGETTVVTSPYYLLGKTRPSSDFPEYDSTSYEHLAGERCTYNGTKYVCKESHGMGAFDASKWSLSIGQYSMVEGHNCIASGINSHAEGASTTAIGHESHSEGNNTLALGNGSHAEGLNTKATGRFSHVQGEYTIAVSECSTVIGRYNNPSDHAYCALQIGNGNDQSSRSNALIVDWDGRVDINNVPSVESNDEAYIKIRHSGIDSDGATPSSSVYSNNLHSFDTDGTRIGYTESVHNTNDDICMNIGASREVNGSMVYNSITAKVSASGERTYALGSPENFRNAIRLKDAISFQTATSTNNSYTAGQVKTITITNGAVKSGCTAIAIRGWNINNSSSGGANSSGINMFSCMISGNNIVLETKNTASSTAKVDFYVYVTFVENY